MPQPFPFLRPWLIGRAAPDPAGGGRPLFYASDLFLVAIFLAALADILFSLVG
jgi:hypothetical protein